MKRLISAILVMLLLTLGFCGCTGNAAEKTTVAATTWPVFQFTQAVCEGSDLAVTQIVTGQISCLHDYTLTVRQMQAIESAELVITSGCDLEEFMAAALANSGDVIECCEGVPLLEGEEGLDPHIWMDPDNAAAMVRNIAAALTERYPENAELFAENAEYYCARLGEIKTYGEETLRELSCRELVTFHDGFAYFAQAFDLHILAALEEEDGATASAETVEEIIGLVRENSLPAIFTETYGSDSAASVIASETGVRIFTLSMAMSGEDYFTAMRHNIDTIREALG